MARNKFPEVTVEKIMEVSQRLFLEKGYDSTTIQDIVEELDGLTRGAVYHHFRSKEEIMDAIGDKMFFENNPFTIVKQRKDLNGLQKMREVIKINRVDVKRSELNKHTLPMLKNPRILARMIETDRRLIAPLWFELIKEGQHDGSIKAKFPKELSELLPLLINLWLAPSVYPGSVEEMMDKLTCIGTMLEAMGLPLIDDEIKEIAVHSFKEMELDD